LPWHWGHRDAKRAKWGAGAAWGVESRVKAKRSCLLFSYAGRSLKKRSKRGLAAIFPGHIAEAKYLGEASTYWYSGEKGGGRRKGTLPAFACSVQ